MMRVLRTTLAAALTLAAVNVTFAQDASADAKDKAPASQPTSAAPVEPEKLKQLLPETLGGLKRLEAKAEQTELAGMKTSKASASYAGKELSKPENPRIEVVISDPSADKSALKSLRSIARSKVDKEDDKGFHKALKIQDQPAVQQYINDDKTGMLQVVVAERFYIVLTTFNLSGDEFKKVGDELKIKELAALK